MRLYALQPGIDICFFFLPQAICRDHWAIHLSTLKVPPPPEPYTYAAGDHLEGVSEDEVREAAPAKLKSRSRSKTKSGRNPVARERNDLESEESDGSNGDDQTDGDDDQSRHTSGSELESEEDPAMAALLEEAEKHREDESDGEDEGVPPPLPDHNRVRKAEGNRRGDDSPLSTVGVLVSACWTLRVPIIYMDFITCVFSPHFHGRSGRVPRPKGTRIHAALTD